MLRLTHRWPGLVAGLVVLVLALSGAALSVFPAIERAGAPQAASALSVAELTTRVQQSHPG
ncbi:MAG: PepSY domain-containing protein, partial [Paracoccaceae bacterium]